MDAQSPRFGCFNLQHASAPGTVFLSDISHDGQLSRRRKAHTKSRSGCTSCKARKVKCDEQQPCRNCTKRNQQCTFVTSTKQKPPSASCCPPIEKPIRTSPALSAPELSPINMTQLRLLHHFEMFTSGTFVMDSRNWKHAVIKLALQNEFLMHAVFLVTSAHLHHLQPHEKGHELLALESFSQVLPLFRNAIATISDGTGHSEDWAEALVACGVLILQYSWTFESQGWGLSASYRGLKDMTLAVADKIGCGSLSPMLLYSPRLHIEHCMRSAAVAAPPEPVFAHIITCTKISDTQPKDPNDFYLPMQRLTAILWALDPDDKRQEDSTLKFDAARYLFTLPSFLPSGFIRLLNSEDGRAQVTILYYFAAISRLESERFWWMRKRAVQMFRQISGYVGDRCEQCTSRAKEIFRNEDLG